MTVPEKPVSVECYESVPCLLVCDAEFGVELLPEVLQLLLQVVPLFLQGHTPDLILLPHVLPG